MEEEKEICVDIYPNRMFSDLCCVTEEVLIFLTDYFAFSMRKIQRRVQYLSTIKEKDLKKIGMKFVLARHGRLRAFLPAENYTVKR